MILSDVYTMRAQKNIDGLLNALCDDEACVRKGAAVALGGFQDARVKEALGRLRFDDPILDVRQAAGRSHELIVAAMMGQKEEGER
jgi:HEAT repeat protein